MTEEIANANWTGPENWAWGEIADGRVALFAAESGSLDPLVQEEWEASRTISGAFLRAILFEKNWTDQVPIDGVRITGARWTDDVTLTHANLKWPLCLEKCRFDALVDLHGLRIDGRLSLKDSAFYGTGNELSLILERAAVKRADLSGGTFRKGAAAAGVVVDGDFDFEGAVFEDTLDLESAKAGSLSLRHGSAQQITLSYCEIDRHADLSGAVISGPVKMNGFRVGQDLSLGGSETAPAVFKKEISLVGAFVGGSLWLSGATVYGALKMNGLEVKKGLFMRAPRKEDEKAKKGRTRFAGTVDLTAAVIHGYLELLGATCKGPVTLVATQIGDNLSAWTEKFLPTVFHRPITMSMSRIKGSADFSGARFRGDFNFTSGRIDGNLYLGGALFEKSLVLADSWIGGHLVMDDYKEARPRCNGEISLQNATIGGQIEFTGRCNGPLTCSGLQVERHLFIRAVARGEGASFPHFKGKAFFGYANIKGIVDLNGATFEAGLDMESIQVGRDLRLTATLGGPISISAGDVGGSVTLSTVTASGADLRGLHVGQDLKLIGKFGQAVTLSQARIDRVLDTTAAHFNEHLDLSASTIGSQLRVRLPSREAAAEKSAKLDLRDAKAGSLQVARPHPPARSHGSQAGPVAVAGGAAGGVVAPRADAEDWPHAGSVQLDGFAFDRLGGFGVEPNEEMMEREAAWFIQWLRLDHPYSPQPYEHLASVLRQAGAAGKANRILHAGRERARKEAWSIRRPLESIRGFPRALGLGLLKVTTGYGIGLRFFYALIWIALLTGIGLIALGGGIAGQPGGVQLHSWPQKAFYSFDQLLPIVELDRSFADVKLSGRVAAYFWAHRFFGFLLGAFITAGIAGLTQRSRS